MRVLHVLAELRASGAEVMLREAAPSFRSHGLETVILATGEEEGAFAEVLRGVGFRVLHLPFERTGAFAAAFRRLVRDERPAIVNIHTERGNAALGGLARLAGAKVIRTVHNNFAYEGRLRAVRTVERAALRVIGVRHVAIGPSVKRNERDRLRNPTIRIDNWIGERFRPPSDDERDAARRSLGIAGDAVVLASIGNCSVVKNHQAILDALPTLAQRTTRPIVYLHAGSGADAEARERVAARDLGLDEAVRFLGRVDDVRGVLWAADVYCMPSLFEGLGIAALEALACGVPSVLADDAGLRDVHPESATVRFVRPTASGVVEGVEELAPWSARADLVAAARVVAERVIAERSVARQVARLVAVYDSDRSPASQA